IESFDWNGSMIQYLKDSISLFWNDRFGDVGVGALLTLRVHLSCDVKVGRSGDNRVVCVVGRSIQPGVNHLVRAALGGAAVDVVSHRFPVSGVPGKIDVRRAWGHSRTGQRFRRW